MKRLVNGAFEQFQKRCAHDSADVSADILEGNDKTGWAVMWCRRCGAYRRAQELQYTVPRATWTGPGK